MLRRTIFTALTVAAGIGAAIVVKLLQEQEEEKDVFHGDDEVHFIRINDEENDNDALRDNPLFQDVDEYEEGELDLDEYLNRASDLIDPKEETVPQEVLEICAVYPYLDAEFVEDLLGKHEALNNEYPEDTLVTVSHMTKFPNQETADEFAKIMDNAGYVCTQVATSVKAVKKFFTEPGAIISDILNVANQTKAIAGEYVEYAISK